MTVRLLPVCTLCGFLWLVPGTCTLFAQPTSATTMAVGRRPTSAVFSFDSREAWVVSAGANAVHVVDRETPFTHETVSVPHVPEQISLSADGRYAFVTSQDLPYPDGFPLNDCDLVIVEPQGGRVTIIETATRRVLAVVPITSGRPIVALPARRGDRLFVVTEAGTVEVVDLATRAWSATIDLGPGQIFDAALHPDGRKLFVTRFTPASDLVVFDTRTYGTRPVTLASAGYRAFFGGRLSFDPSGAFLFANAASASDFRRYTLVFDTRSETPADFVPGGFGAIAFSPDGRRAYLFSPEFLPGPGAPGVVLDLPGLTTVQTLPVGGQAAVMAMDGSKLYLARYGAPFRYSLTVADAYRFRYDVTTIQPGTGTYSGQDVDPNLVGCTVGRSLVLSPDGRNLLVTNPAVDTVTWLTIPPPPAGASFHTIAPCRLVDSRLSPGTLTVPHGGPPLAVGTERILPVTGHCGIPTTARAVTVNLTVTQGASAGHLTVSPAGLPPSNTSTLNFAPGKTRANGATIPLGPSGALTISAGLPAGTVDFLVDVCGYWQ